ncbi:MAG: signal peptidase II [Treponema sp.]|nr:signal peptidase II [Treponema sp.]
MKFVKKLGMQFDKERGLPFLLSGIVIIIDQITKAIIATKWPIPEGHRYVFITDVFNNGFFQIIHVRNPAIAFSLGSGIPDSIKPITFIVLPILVLCLLLWYYLSSNDFTRLQRWAVAGILGGGIGNIIDRIFRPDGVVDFIDVRFFDFIFASGRWPTFNVADSSVVVCCLLLFVTIIFSGNNTKKEKAK